MNNFNFDQKSFKGMELPLQKLMELNMKAMQSMSYMKPLDLMSLKNPEQVFEKNMDMFVHNSQVAMNYMRDTFNILSNHCFDVTRQTEETVKQNVNQASSAMKKTMQKSASSATSTVKKTAAKVRSAVKSPVKAAAKTASKLSSKSGVKKTSTQTKPASKAAKPMNNRSHASSSAKHAARPTANKAKSSHTPSRDMGHSMPKVNTLSQKSEANKSSNMSN